MAKNCYVYNLEFDEGLEAGTDLIQLRAHDPDSDVNGEIIYEITGSDSRIYNTFQINPKNGMLSLKKRLDFSTKSMWQLSVKATDQCLNLDSRRSSIAIVNLRVNDVNDHKPEINIHFFAISGVIEPRILKIKVKMNFQN
jgi:hypothetical protein